LNLLPLLNPLNPALTLTILVAGGIAGALGIALGLGGGIFLVPFLTLALGFPLKSAAAISLATVIATSSAVSARRAGSHLINLRLGMVLEVATTAGSLLGGITAQFVAESTLQRLFGLVAIAVALAMVARINRRNVIADPDADSGRLGGRFYEAESGGVVRAAYSVDEQRAIADPFVATAHLVTLLEMRAAPLREARPKRNRGPSAVVRALPARP